MLVVSPQGPLRRRGRLRPEPAGSRAGSRAASAPGSNPGASLAASAPGSNPGASLAASAPGSNPGASLAVALVSFLVFASSACSSADPLALRLDIPLTGSERALLIAVSGPDPSDPGSIQARSITDGAVSPLILPAGRSTHVTFTAALYDEPLIELELTEGLVASPPEGTPSRPLPPPAHAYESNLSGGEATSWAPLGDLGPALRGLRIPATRHCAPLSPSRDAPFPLAAGVRSAVAIARREGQPDDAVLLLLENDAMVELSPTASTAVMLHLMKPKGMFRDTGSRLWLGVGDGEIVRALYSASGKSVDGSLQGFLTSRFEGRWMAGPVGAQAASEIYVLAAKARNGTTPEQGYLERYDPSVPGGSQLQFYPPGGLSEPLSKGGVAWGGPERALGLWPYRALDNVTLVDHDSPRTLTVEGAQAIAYPPEIGPLIGTNDGVASVAGSTLERLESGPVKVTAMAARPGGFLASNANGLFRYLAGYGYCTTTTTLPLRPRLLVPVGLDVVVIGVDPEADTRYLAVWLMAP